MIELVELPPAQFQAWHRRHLLRLQQLTGEEHPAWRSLTPSLRRTARASLSRVLTAIGDPTKDR